MGKSKNFNLFLMDGDVGGRIKCTVANWTGLAFKIPNSYLEKCKDRQDLKQSGVYFLFGKDENGEDDVYVGQAGIRKNGEGILYRVVEHLSDISMFNDAVILTTQNNSFGPTEISYLENRFTNLAKQACRYIVRNANDPNAGNVTEEKESELEDFIEYSKMVIGVLGYKIFVPILKNEEETNIITNNSTDDKALDLYLTIKTKKEGHEIKARCKKTSEGFVVLKGSMIVAESAETLPESLKNMREKAIEQGEIVDGKITKDYLFGSASYAASFIIGARMNGRTYWKTETGMTLKKYEELRKEEIQRDLKK